MKYSINVLYALGNVSYALDQTTRKNAQFATQVSSDSIWVVMRSVRMVTGVIDRTISASVIKFVYLIE